MKTITIRLIYSVSKCLKILEKDMTELDAMEHFTFNVSGAFGGEKTPIWCWIILHNVESMGSYCPTKYR